VELNRKYPDARANIEVGATATRARARAPLRPT
jgi:hypothetical protein